MIRAPIRAETFGLEVRVVIVGACTSKGVNTRSTFSLVFGQGFITIQATVSPIADAASQVKPRHQASLYLSLLRRAR